MDPLGQTRVSDLVVLGVLEDEVRRWEIIVSPCAKEVAEEQPSHRGNVIARAQGRRIGMLGPPRHWDILASRHQTIALNLQAALTTPAQPARCTRHSARRLSAAARHHVRQASSREEAPPSRPPPSPREIDQYSKEIDPKLIPYRRASLQSPIWTSPRTMRRRPLRPPPLPPLHPSPRR